MFYCYQSFYLFYEVMSLLNEKLCQCYDFYFLLPFNLDYVIFRIKFNIVVDGWVSIVVEAGQSMNLWWEHACCLCYLYKKFRSSILISYYFLLFYTLSYQMFWCESVNNNLCDWILLRYAKSLLQFAQRHLQQILISWQSHLN